MRRRGLRTYRRVFDNQPTVSVPAVQFSQVLESGEFFERVGRGYVEDRGQRRNGEYLFRPDYEDRE